MNSADRIIEYTARTESGGRYDAWNPDDNGRGVSYGLIQFNQKVGTLPEVLRDMRAANPARFDAIFGKYASGMATPSWVRAANLNDPAIATYSRGVLTGGAMYHASREPDFQAVQRAWAKSGYFDPSVQAAQAVGLKSERAMAMLFDTSVQWGDAQMRTFLVQALRSFSGQASEKDVLTKFASLADGSKYQRRTKILSDPNLSDDVYGGFMTALIEADETSVYAVTAVIAGAALLLWWYIRR